MSLLISMCHKATMKTMHAVCLKHCHKPVQNTQEDLGQYHAAPDALALYDATPSTVMVSIVQNR